MCESPPHIHTHTHTHTHFDEKASAAEEKIDLNEIYLSNNVNRMFLVAVCFQIDVTAIQTTWHSYSNG
jgi:kynurenine formamidase